MKIVLKKLELGKFRDLSGSFEFGENQNVISGPNGSGKTTLFDAEVWCRTGKDSMGRTDFDIKQYKDGRHDPEAEHSVVATYEVEGEEHTFGRTYYEKWVRKRGSRKAEKTGNETKYFFDGLELNKTKFQKKMDSLFGDHFNVCSDTAFLTSMHWKERREFLKGLIPETDHDSIIDGIKGFSKLLDSRSVEDAKSHYDQLRKNLDKEVTGINASIKELKSLDASADMTVEEADAIVSQAIVAHNNAKKEVDEYSSSDREQLLAEISHLNTQLFELENIHEDAVNSARREWKDVEQRKDALLADIRDFEYTISKKKSEREKLLSEYKSIKEKTLENLKDTCEYCGAELPEEKIEEQKENFNRIKSQRLESNITTGKATSLDIEKFENQVMKLKEDLEKLSMKVQPEILSAPVPKEIEDLRNRISELKSEDPGEEIPTVLLQKREQAEFDLDQARQKLSSVKAAENTRKRLEELSERKQEISSDYDKIEAFSTKFEEYNQAMADAIEKPVNDLFEKAHFKMFDVQENGTIVPNCIVMDKNLKPFDTSLSNGERIQVGVDICKTLQKTLNYQAPIWIDNAEAVTSPIVIDGQHVSLIATDGTDSLTITK
jgi:DNA repair exonuclease SbcCD ATPase subunit